MGTDRTDAEKDESVKRRIREAAERAREEAAARRNAVDAGPRPREVGPREIGGRDGPEPVRYGDWEKDGIASDF